MTPTDPVAPETQRPVTHTPDAPPPPPRRLFLLSDDLRVHCLKAVGLVGTILGAGVLLASVDWVVYGWYLGAPRPRPLSCAIPLAYIAMGVFLLIAAIAALRNRPHACRYLRIYAYLGIAYAALMGVGSVITVIYSSPMVFPLRIIEAMRGGLSEFSHDVVIPLLVLLLVSHPTVKELPDDPTRGFQVIRPTSPGDEIAPPPPLPVQKL